LQESLKTNGFDESIFDQEMKALMFRKNEAMGRLAAKEQENEALVFAIRNVKHEKDLQVLAAPMVNSVVISDDLGPPSLMKETKKGKTVNFDLGEEEMRSKKSIDHVVESVVTPVNLNKFQENV
jgi:hypothetical protein